MNKSPFLKVTAFITESGQVCCMCHHNTTTVIHLQWIWYVYMFHKHFGCCDSEMTPPPPKWGKIVFWHLTPSISWAMMYYMNILHIPMCSYLMANSIYIYSFTLLWLPYTNWPYLGNEHLCPECQHALSCLVFHPEISKKRDFLFNMVKQLFFHQGVSKMSFMYRKTMKCKQGQVSMEASGLKLR